MPKKLNTRSTTTLAVEKNEQGWYLRGVATATSGFHDPNAPDTRLLRMVAYPESEWPEIDSTIESSDAMHQTLYDLWQTSEALEKLSQDSHIVFDTPYGKFYTFSYSVLSQQERDTLIDRVASSEVDLSSLLDRAEALTKNTFAIERFLRGNDFTVPAEEDLHTALYRVENEVKLLAFVDPDRAEPFLRRYQTVIESLPADVQERVARYGFARF